METKAERVGRSRILKGHANNFFLSGGGGLRWLPKAKVGDLLTWDDQSIAANNGDHSFMSSITTSNIYKI